MKTASCKAKSRRLQDSIRGAILKAFPTLHANDVKTAIMGETGTDIHMSEKALQSFPYAVECKNQEASKMIYDWYDQAVSNQTIESWPVLFVKRNRRETLAVIDAKLFFELNKKLSELSQKD